MENTIQLTKEERECLWKSGQIIQRLLGGGLEVKESEIKAPKLSAEQKRQNKYKKLLREKGVA